MKKELSDKHKKFALAIFDGMTIQDAYAYAGYKRHHPNALRLAASPDIKEFLRDLQRQAVNKTVEATAFSAQQIFSRMINRADAAAEAGDHKAAIEAEKFIAECLGYKDSPTLTHESLHGKQEAPPEPSLDRDDNKGNVVPLNKALAKMREIKAGK